MAVRRKRIERGVTVSIDISVCDAREGGGGGEDIPTQADSSLASSPDRTCYDAASSVSQR